MKKRLAKIASLFLIGFSSSYAALVSVPAGDITIDTTWTSDNEYILEGIVYVKDATLTIQPGTIIRGQPRTNANTYNPGTLVITNSASISAVGTATNPIIFTTACLNNAGVPLDSNADGYFDRASVVSGALASGTFLDSDPKNNPLPPTSASTYLNAQYAAAPTNVLAGLCGGIIIMGEAPTNADNRVATGFGGFFEGLAYVEGLSAGVDTTYGGINPFDNSGKLSYISIRHGGAKLSDANEINGLTLAGVGSGTQVDHIDIYVNLDDGVEIFGGTVMLNYININFVEDDGLDVDQGWTGAAQFVFVLQHPDFGDSLGEWDGADEDSANGGGVDYMTSNGIPFAHSVIANGTFVGRGTGIRTGLRMRAGFGGEVLNNIVVQAKEGIRIDPETGIESDGFDARSRAILGELTFRGNTLFNNTNNDLSFTQASPANFVAGTFDTTTAGWNNLNASNPGFKAFDVTSYVNPVGVQTGMGGTPAAFSNVATLPNNAFFTTVAYRGAFSTSKLVDLWTNNWTALNKRGVLVSKGNQ
jgi:hypothetical protein